MPLFIDRMQDIDATHTPTRLSWVGSANGHPEFPVQNLPFGVFRPEQGEPRGGIALGDVIIDLSALSRSGILSGAAQHAADLAARDSLNAFFGAGTIARSALRAAVSDLFSDAGHENRLRPCLRDRNVCTMMPPMQIGDYTDFYAGIHHARRIGEMFRPDNPLLPNYRYVPIGYHGRSSSIRVSGHEVRRPLGQCKEPESAGPVVRPTRRLDFELELGIWVGAGNPLGERVPIDDAPAHVAGFSLLNDWSARDIQAWEYQPLGPFLAKNFATTISPWIVTPEALAPFRVGQQARSSDEPHPLDYLWSDRDQALGAYDIDLRVHIRSQDMRTRSIEPFEITRSSSRHLYWTVAQLLTHHTMGGCNLNAGDLLGTGTISGPDDGSCGSMMEMTLNGQNALTLPSGEKRTFLEDGDEIILTGHAARDGFASIGFGECRAVVTPSCRARI